MPKPKNPASTLQEKCVDDLKFSLDTVVKTSVRKTVSAARYLDALKEKGAIENHGECICLIKCGDKAILGGQGEIFEKLVATKNIAGTFQEQDAFKTVFNPDYETSKLQIVRFDQCFKKLPKDARGDIAFKPGVDTIFKDKRGPRGSYQKNALKNAKECDVSGDSMKDPTYDNNPIISLEEAGADNVAQVFFPATKSRKRKVTSTIVTAQPSMQMQNKDESATASAAAKSDGNVLSQTQAKAAHVPVLPKKSGQGHKAQGGTSDRKRKTSSPKSALSRRCQSAKKRPLMSRALFMQPTTSVHAERNVQYQRDMSTNPDKDKDKASKVTVGCNVEQTKSSQTSSNEPPSSLPLKKRNIDNPVSIEEPPDDRPGNSSSSETDELSRGNLWSTAVSLGESTVNLSQSVTESDEGLISSQDILPSNFYEDPIEEYFTSKENNHNNSSVFWEENMSKFAPDSLW